MLFKILASALGSDVTEADEPLTLAFVEYWKRLLNDGEPDREIWDYVCSFLDPSHFVAPPT